MLHTNTSVKVKTSFVLNKREKAGHWSATHLFENVFPCWCDRILAEALMGLQYLSKLLIPLKKKLQSYPRGPKLFAYQHKCSILTAPTRRWPCICSNIRPRKLWSAVSSCLSGAKWIFDVWCTIALKIHNKMLSPLFCTSFHFDVVPKSNYFIFS